MKRGRKPGSRKIWPSDALIRQWASEGKSYDEIAAMLCKGKATVYSYCRKHDITVQAKSQDKPERDKAVCDLYLSGKTLQECGDIFGITRERIRQILNKNGISERRQWAIRNNGSLEVARSLYGAGVSWDEIGEITGYSKYLLRQGLRPSAQLRRQRRIAEFWQAATVTADPEQCWPWKGSTGVNGHARFGFQGKSRSAHAIAFMLANGREPKDWVLHKCDNPPCVNPAHLYEGTPADNVKDRDSRGRGAHQNGKIGKRKLTPESIKEIKHLLDQGLTQVKVAEMMGVTFSTINAVNTGKRGLCLCRPDQLPTNTLIELHKELVSGKVSQAAVSRRYQLNPATVSRIKQGTYWRIKNLVRDSTFSVDTLH